MSLRWKSAAKMWRGLMHETRDMLMSQAVEKYGGSICSFCGEVTPRNEAADHMRTCAKHPLAAAERALYEAREALRKIARDSEDELTRECARAALPAPVPRTDGPCSPRRNSVETPPAPSAAPLTPLPESKAVAELRILLDAVRTLWDADRAWNKHVSDAEGDAEASDVACAELETTGPCEAGDELRRDRWEALDSIHGAAHRIARQVFGYDFHERRASEVHREEAARGAGDVRSDLIAIGEAWHACNEGRAPNEIENERRKCANELLRFARRLPMPDPRPAGCGCPVERVVKVLKGCTKHGGGHE